MGDNKYQVCAEQAAEIRNQVMKLKNPLLPSRGFPTDLNGRSTIIIIITLCQ